MRQAVDESLAALDWLRDGRLPAVLLQVLLDLRQHRAGNIGPVADALIAALGCGFALACPAFPANARSVYLGHLFVGGALLNESGMEHHPLTPMTDANLVRVLSRQTDGTVGLVPYATVEQGAMAIRQAMTALKEQGRRYAIVDAVSDCASGGDRRGGRAPRADHRRFRRRDGPAGEFPPRGHAAGAERCGCAADARRSRRGAGRVLFARHARRSLAIAREHVPVLQLDPLATPDAARMAAMARDWMADKLGATPVVIAASAPPDKVAATASSAWGARRPAR